MGKEADLVLQAWKFQLAQRLADSQEPVVGAVLAVAGPVGDEAHLGPFLPGGIRLVVEVADGVPLLPGQLGHRRLECMGDIGSHGELDHAEALVAALGAVLEQVLLVACRVGAHEDLFHSRRQRGQRFLEHAQLFITRRHVAVAKLRVHDQLLLGPINVEGLVGLEVLVQ